MADVNNVPIELLLSNVAQTLKGDERIKVPEWTKFVKAGIHREKSWEQPDWYYLRLASTLRKVYLNGPIGTTKLSQEYGGKVDRGSKRYHPSQGSRSIVRHMLETLETLGYVKKEPKGRVIAPAGQSLLVNASKAAIKELAEKDKTFEKFL